MIRPCQPFSCGKLCRILALYGHNGRSRGIWVEGWRRIFLYISGVISFAVPCGVPHRSPSSRSASLTSVFVSKEGSSIRKLDERIDSPDIRTARQNRTRLAFGIVEVHAILAPVVPVFHQFKLAP